MGKKIGDNPKITAAREREEAKKAEKDAKAAKEQEDRFWKEAGEGSKSKAQSKREDQEKQRLEALAKKAEARKLAEQEEAEVLVKKLPKAKPTTTSKMTQFQLNQQKEHEQKIKQDELREKELASKRMVSEDAYVKLVETQIQNRQDDVIEATGVDQALGALVIGDDLPQDKHPEKRMRAAWVAFQEREMPILKQEKPGLKLNQYRDLCWKMWQKSPDNPLNQAKAAA